MPAKTPMTLLRHAAIAWSAVAVAAVLTATPAHAQDESIDDDLADILGTGDTPTEGTVAEERRAVEEAAPVAVARTETVDLPPARKKLIKTLQPKYFLKLGRGEVMPFVGLVTNDPFLRRVLFGASLGYHVTEVLALELNGSYSPTFGPEGRGDFKGVTAQITEENAVAPEISRLTAHATLNLSYSPFYGKVATRRRGAIVFDLYGLFGTGIAYTVDDLAITNSEGEAVAEATRTQVHPAISFGGGLRVAFTKAVALRFEARSLSYIGTYESTSLELKNNLALMLGASFFVGRKPE